MCQHRAHHVPVHLDCEAPDHADKNPDRQRLVLLMGIRTQGAPLPHLDCEAPNHADKNPDRQRLVLLALVLRHSNICGGNSKPGGGCFGGGVVGAVPPTAGAGAEACGPKLVLHFAQADRRGHLRGLRVAYAIEVPCRLGKACSFSLGLVKSSRPAAIALSRTSSSSLSSAAAAADDASCAGPPAPFLASVKHSWQTGT